MTSESEVSHAFNKRLGDLQWTLNVVFVTFHFHFKGDEVVKYRRGGGEAK